MGRRIAIGGAGAVGSYTGAHMAKAGEDVTFAGIASSQSLSLGGAERRPVGSSQ